MLAKQAAREAGAFEAWFVDRAGFVTEGASTNAWIVAADGALVTRQADEAILRGVTRAALIDIAAGTGPAARGAAVHAAGGAGAREAFVSSATTIATPVVAIDGQADRGRPARACGYGVRRAFDVAAGAETEGRFNNVVSDYGVRVCE